MADSKDLSFVQGKTFNLVLQWETEPVVYKAITAISQTAPARMTVPGHGMPDGWRGVVTNVKGMTDINATANALRERDYTPGTVIDAATIDLNEVNAAGFKAYVSGGIWQYNTPVDITGYTARMAVKPKAGTGTRLRCATGGTSGSTKPSAAGTDGTVVWAAETTLSSTKEWIAGTAYTIGDVVDVTDLIFLSTTNGRIVLDTTRKTITLTVSATDTAAMTWKKGAYDLEMVSPTGIVTALLTGNVTVAKEVTT